MKSHTLFRTERSKTIPCSAAHPRIGYIREYPPPPPPGPLQRFLTFTYSLNSTWGLFLCLVCNLGAIRGHFRQVFGSLLFAVLFLLRFMWRNNTANNTEPKTRLQRPQIAPELYTGYKAKPHVELTEVHFHTHNYILALC